MRKSEVILKWVVSIDTDSEMEQDEQHMVASATRSINGMSDTFFGDMLNQWESSMSMISSETGVTEKLVRYAYISALDKFVRNLKNISWKSGIDKTIFGSVLNGDFEFALDDEDIEDRNINRNIKKDGFH